MNIQGFLFPKKTTKQATQATTWATVVAATTEETSSDSHHVIHVELAIGQSVPNLIKIEAALLLGLLGLTTQ